MGDDCNRCKKPLSGTVITALAKKYHNYCFACFLCQGSLDGPFYGVMDLPFCEKCIDEAEALEKSGQLEARVSSANSAANQEVAVAQKKGNSDDADSKPLLFDPPAAAADPGNWDVFSLFFLVFSFFFFFSPPLPNRSTLRRKGRIA
jgi:hypothetical protein